MANNSVLIVDDEEDIRDIVSDVLTDRGFECFTAANSDEALEILQNSNPSIVLLDIWLQGSNLDGLGILEVINSRYHTTPTIMISGHGTIETAVSAIKMGAYDYIEKPFNTEKLLITVARAFESLRLKKENSELKKKITKKSDITGSSRPILALKEMIEKVAPTSSRVLIEGEPGSGRELAAKMIHRRSSNSKGAFIKLNSPMIISDKSQRAFFEGDGANLGLVELAKNGTLFINEVGRMPLYAQHKVLTLIKDINKSAEDSSKQCNIRIIASTSQDLKKEVKLGNFLQDLYYRLNVISIRIPTLAERREDIPELCDYFLSLFEKTTNLTRVSFELRVIEALQKYDWPGDVRQLKNLVECLLILAQINNTSMVTTDMLPSYILGNKQTGFGKDLSFDEDVISLPLRDARELFEKKYLTTQMVRFSNNISKTASFVGMERSALHRKLKLLSIYHPESKCFADEVAAADN